MGKDKNSFVFYRSFYDALSKCTPKVRCEVLDAILSYSFEGIMPKMTALADTLFTLIKPQLDANAERYTNGIKGGREIKVTDEIREQIKEDYNADIPVSDLVKKYNLSKSTIYNVLSFQKPMDNGKTSFQKPNDNDNVNVNENVNVNVNENENENEGGSGNITSSDFPSGNDDSPETLDEVIQTYTSDTDIKAALNDFVDMRTRIRKPLTPRALKLLLDKLDSIATSKQDKLTTINNSVMGAWQGFYKSDDNKNNGAKGKKLSFTDIDNHNYTETDYNSMFDNFGGTT